MGAPLMASSNNNDSNALPAIEVFTKNRILELLGSQTGNPELFLKDHASDYKNWTKAELLKLLKDKTFQGALDPKSENGHHYFSLKKALKDKSWVAMYSSYCDLLLCPTLKEATHLVRLVLSGNKLSAVPGLDSLTNLRELELGDNQLTTLPGLGALKNLRELDLSQNQLVTLPELDTLTNLKILDLEYNKLVALPRLDALKNLEGLYIKNNQLTSLPGLSTLKNLKRLYIENNQLTTLPGLEVLTNLQRLELRGNDFTALPGLEALINLQQIFLDETQTNREGILRPLVTLMDQQKERNLPVVQVYEHYQEITAENLRNHLEQVFGLGQTQVAQ